MSNDNWTLGALEEIPDVLVRADTHYPFELKVEGDVGYDLYAHVFTEKQTWLDKLLSRVLRRECYIIWPLGTRNVDAMIYLHMPDWLWCQLHCRSSVLKRNIDILGGVIDSGYQGQLFSNLHNFGLRPRLVLHGERYAQVVFYTAIRPDFKFVDKFEKNTQRGAQGFGSTGR